jgi:hypothetical protein
MGGRACSYRGPIAARRLHRQAAGHRIRDAYLNSNTYCHSDLDTNGDSHCNCNSNAETYAHASVSADAATAPDASTLSYGTPIVGRLCQTPSWATPMGVSQKRPTIPSRSHS